MVMSREDARAFTYSNELNKPTIIISISNTNEEPNIFNKGNENIINILYLQFDDNERGEPNCMTREDAEKIISFINNNISRAECVLVHCGAGISRSAGVAAALMLIINGDDFPIFNSSKYIPNSNCYKLLLDTFFGSYNEDEIESKFKRNIELWRAEQDLD